jgi:hypothetical protein
MKIKVSSPVKIRKRVLASVIVYLVRAQNFKRMIPTKCTFLPRLYSLFLTFQKPPSHPPPQHEPEFVNVSEALESIPPASVAPDQYDKQGYHTGPPEPEFVNV